MNKSPQPNPPYLLLIIPKFQPMALLDLPKVLWSSPLHVVPKSDSTVRPVGDRQLNSVTEFDSYPHAYLNDFAHALHGKKIFSKIDIFISPPNPYS
ncbi:retrovirus-related Pol polyprotein from transposon opus [Trichonephila clavipes]|nr:retrovirus-related Pol polyprotein from transposon opus [Trichonephila clavipes]